MNRRDLLVGLLATFALSETLQRSRFSELSVSPRKLMRAPLIVKRTTSITGELWAAFTAGQVASRLAEIANFSRTQPEATSKSDVEILGAALSAVGPKADLGHSFAFFWPRQPWELSRNAAGAVMLPLPFKPRNCCA
jgi:hypothetical protein